MQRTETAIDRVRREIARTDARLAAGVLRRLALARQVGRAKRRARLPLRDDAVEAAAVGRWVSRLGAGGVAPGRGEALARWLIEESVRVQEPFASRGDGAAAAARDVAIVGGAGEMGRWLGDFLEAGGDHVGVLDPRPPPRGRPRYRDLAAAARTADIIVLSTPIRATAPLLRRLVDLRPDGLVFDVLSVKAPIVPELLRGVRRGLRITSVHPMFGPSARTLSGRNLLVVGCGSPPADREARALFASSALSITEVPLRRHDRLIAESLGLSHAVNLLFLEALAGAAVSRKELARAASTTFHRQSSLALAVAREGAELYLDIQALNPGSSRVYDDLERGLRSLRTIARRSDLRAFQSLLQRGQAKLETGPAPMRA